MAYMSKDHKKEIAELLKKEFGVNAKKRGFKYSLKIENYSTIVMTISSGDVDFIGSYVENHTPSRFDFHDFENNSPKHLNVHNNMIDCFDGKAKEILEKAMKHLNLRNYDNSDSMTDYFDVGHYVYIHIGSWDKPYVLNSSK